MAPNSDETRQQTPSIVNPPTFPRQQSTPSMLLQHTQYPGMGFDDSDSYTPRKAMAATHNMSSGSF